MQRRRGGARVQRPAATKVGALACPSCRARRILPGMLYYDQCGKRIPESLIEKFRHSEAARPQRGSRLTNTAEGLHETVPSRQSMDVASSSVDIDVAGLRDGGANSQTDATGRGQEMRGASAPSDMLVGRQRVVGVSLVAFGILMAVASALIGAVNLSGLGLASFLIGLLLVYLNSRPSFPPELVEASLLSSLANVERILHELGPRTKAIYLKTIDRLDVPMVFLPLEENSPPPSGLNLSGEDRLLVIDSDDSHRTGLLLEAPGASLLALMEKELDLNFIDLGNDDFLNAIRSGMVKSLEVAADVKATVTPEGVEFRIRDGALRGLSQSVARSVPNVASRLGCPICSAVVCATVKAVKSDMILEEATHQLGSHTVTLKFARGATSETS